MRVERKPLETTASGVPLAKEVFRPTHPLIVISAPAGTGKTTLALALLRERSDLRRAVSCTTRLRRRGERHRRDYYFVSAQEFAALDASDQFIETNDLFAARYGTLKGEVVRLQRIGYRVLLVIDAEGALELQRRFPCQTIFLVPPSPAELKRRLLSRGTEDAESIQLRLERANFEMALSHRFDHRLINDDFQATLAAANQIIGPKGQAISADLNLNGA